MGVERSHVALRYLGRINYLLLFIWVLIKLLFAHLGAIDSTDIVLPEVYLLAARSG